MNYIEMTQQCDLCRVINNDVSCEECILFNRCLLHEYSTEIKIMNEDEISYMVNYFDTLSEYDQDNIIQGFEYMNMLTIDMERINYENPT